MQCVPEIYHFLEKAESKSQKQQKIAVFGFL
jgi:hypothetical protein